MSRAERVAWGLACVAVSARAAAPVLQITAGAKPAGDALAGVVDIGLAFSLCFPVMGALVIRRRGGHAVGWLLSAIGVSIALHVVIAAWGDTAHDHPGSLPFGDAAHWMGMWLWFPGWTLVTTLLPALFPDGRASGGRRRLARADAIGVAGARAALAAVTWQLRGAYDEPGDPPSVAVVYVAALLVVSTLTVLSLGSLLRRYRQADPVLRRQIAWVVYGAVIAVVMSVAGALPGSSAAFQVLEAVAVVGGLAIAMFRYDLYDIGVVVNRTLVYAALTATLATTYLASVLVLQLVVTPSSGLAVAASTLATAALFRPARAWIQGAVDRRFYRRKYDAQRTLAAFSAGLRDQVDLSALSGELNRVIRDALQPAHVSLWLRERS